MIFKFSSGLYPLMLGRFFILLSSFISIRIITAYFKPNEVASISIFISTVIFFYILLISPLESYFHRNLHSWKDKKFLKNNLKIYLFTTTFLSILSFIIFFLITKYSKILFSLESISIYLFFFYLISFALSKSINSFFNILGSQKVFIILAVLWSYLAIIVPIILINSSKTSIENWLLGQAIAYFLILNVGIYLFFKIFNNSKNNYSFYSDNRLKNFVIPIGISNFFLWLQQFSYRYILDYYNYINELAYVFSGFLIGSLIVSGVEVINTQFLNPKYFQALEKDTKNNYVNVWTTYFKTFLTTMILVLFFIFLFYENIGNLFLDKSFYEAKKYILIGTMIEILRVLFQVNVLGAHATKKTNVMILPYFINAALTIILVVFFIHNDKFLYAIYSLIASGLIGFIASNYALYKQIKFKQIFKLTKNIISILILCLVILLFIKLTTGFIISVNLYSDFIILSISSLVFLISLIKILVQGEANLSKIYNHDK